jgi:hypothetical protein
LPVTSVEFRQASGSPGIMLDGVIPETGADASVLPWADCQLLQLTPSLGAQGLISGVAGSSTATLVFQVWAQLDGQDYACRLQADFVGGERILGRDVLNRLEILFRGPTGKIIVNPDGGCATLPNGLLHQTAAAILISRNSMPLSAAGVPGHVCLRPLVTDLR